MPASDPARDYTQPLVLTVTFDPPTQAYFEALRTQHFPPERNMIPAHLTLFHALPGCEQESVLRLLRSSLKRKEAIRLEVSSLMKLGRGVAFRIESAALTALHAMLQQQWQHWLTAQDRQGFRPHVVIQNKVEPAAASALYAELTSNFQPFPCTATGLTLWRYLDGPWELLESIPFDGLNNSAMTS